jgi:type I restriction enzyme S subunit
MASLGLLLQGIKDGTHGTFPRTAPGEGMPLLGARNVIGSRVVLDGAESFISEDDYESIVANGFPAKGDVLLVIVGATIGKTAVYDLDTRHAFQRSVAFLRPTGRLESKFLWYQIQASRFQDELTLRAKTSAQPGIYMGDIASIPVVIPPLDEQRVIADYLDRETARIDTLIKEQQRLIEMLRERREAAIRATLMGGLDANSPRQPSGVALLGDIPAHWQMVPARYLCAITTGSEDSGNATDDGDYPFYVRGREVLRIDHYSFEGEAVMTPGDGQGGTGKVFHYVKGKFEAHQRVYVFKDFVGISGWYFYYFLSTFLGPVALAGSNTVTMESLRRPLLADFRVAVPPLDEQGLITAHLDEQTAKMDELITESERFIKLARERRAALITAAVTGQIDVQEMV